MTAGSSLQASACPASGASVSGIAFTVPPHSQQVSNRSSALRTRAEFISQIVRFLFERYSNVEVLAPRQSE